MRKTIAASILAATLFGPTVLAQISSVSLFMDAEGWEDSTTSPVGKRVIGWAQKIRSENQYFRAVEGRVKLLNYCIGAKEIRQNAEFTVQQCNDSIEQGIGIELFKEVDRHKFYRLKMNADPSLCLDMKAGVPATVILWPCKEQDNDNQLWDLPVRAY